jgi:hypothetical protein
MRTEGQDNQRINLTANVILPRRMRIREVKSSYFTYIPFEFLNVLLNSCLCGPVVKVPGYKTEIYCVSREVQT